jgi:hypothetical protein
MNPKSDLFMAILAMDAYNRIGDGVTDRNLNVTGSSLGDVDISLIKGDNGCTPRSQGMISA